MDGKGKIALDLAFPVFIVLYYIKVRSIQDIERSGMGTPGNSHGF